ncbi:MAG: hypothetical protein ACR2OR_17810 [Hyphomicrobiales bacterium]
MIDDGEVAVSKTNSIIEIWRRELKPRPAVKFILPNLVLTRIGNFFVSVLNSGFQKEFVIAKKPIGIIAKTGEVCPESGVWESQDNPSTTAPIAKGNRMPPNSNKAVRWKLIRYA